MIFLMKNDEVIQNLLPYINQNRHAANSSFFLEKDKGQNAEYYLYAEEIIKRNKDVYWLSLDALCEIKNNNEDLKIYHINANNVITVKANSLHQLSDKIIFKTIGNVTEKVTAIENVLKFLAKNYQGTIINDAQFIIYGMDKKYLLDLQDNGFETIKTYFYDRGTDIAKIKNDFSDPTKYIIKPTIGELSKGVYRLSDITNDWWEERNLTGFGERGWIVQPIRPEVFNGEYQLIFFKDTFSHGQVKIVENQNGLPIQATRKIKTSYQPSDKEKEFCLRIKNFIEAKMNKSLNFFRCDFFKDKDGNLLILEFETCNPGFFFHYREREENLIIAKNFIDLIEKKA